MIEIMNPQVIIVFLIGAAIGGIVTLVLMKGTISYISILSARFENHTKEALTAINEQRESLNQREKIVQKAHDEFAKAVKRFKATLTN